MELIRFLIQNMSQYDDKLHYCVTMALPSFESPVLAYRPVYQITDHGSYYK
jgi:hypothetical protein